MFALLLLLSWSLLSRFDLALLRKTLSCWPFFPLCLRPPPPKPNPKYGDNETCGEGTEIWDNTKGFFSSVVTTAQDAAYPSSASPLLRTYSVSQKCADVHRGFVHFTFAMGALDGYRLRGREQKLNHLATLKSKQTFLRKKNSN